MTKIEVGKYYKVIKEYYPEEDSRSFPRVGSIIMITEVIKDKQVLKDLEFSDRSEEAYNFTLIQGSWVEDKEYYLTFSNDSHIARAYLQEVEHSSSDIVKELQDLINQSSKLYE